MARPAATAPRTACAPTLAPALLPPTDLAPGRGQWLSVDAAAAHLGISRRKLYDLTKERRVPFRRVVGTTCIRFAPNDLAWIVAASAVAPAGAVA